MPGSRHRRDVTRRTLAIGAVLATCLGAGLLAFGLASGSGLRVAGMLVLVVAVGAGLLAMDEARLVEARLTADISRERAARSRDASAEVAARASLLRRIDDLEAELTALRRMVLHAPRTVVVVAPDRRAAPRIIEIRDLVPSASAEAFDRPVERPAPSADDRVTVADVRDPGHTSAAAAPHVMSPPHDIDEVRDDEASEDFPIVEVVGEFSLDGLALFPRPAGMPTFPSVTDLPASDEGVDDTRHASEVIDLRDRARSPRSA